MTIHYVERDRLRVRHLVIAELSAAVQMYEFSTVAEEVDLREAEK